MSAKRPRSPSVSGSDAGSDADAGGGSDAEEMRAVGVVTAESEAPRVYDAVRARSAGGAGPPARGAPLRARQGARRARGGDCPRSSRTRVGMVWLLEWRGALCGIVLAQVRRQTWWWLRVQAGMLAALAAIKPPLAWMERLDVCTPEPLDVVAPEDDLARALAVWVGVPCVPRGVVCEDLRARGA